MKTHKPSFKAIDFKQITSAVESFAKDEGVPGLIYPAHAPAEEASPSPQAPPRAKPAQQPTLASSSPVKRLAVDLPVYLMKALGDRAHAQDVTVRYLILKALQNDGYVVQAQDLKADGRRAS